MSNFLKEPSMPPKISVIVFGFPGLSDSTTRFLFSLIKNSLFASNSCIDSSGTKKSNNVTSQLHHLNNQVPISQKHYTWNFIKVAGENDHQRHHRQLSSCSSRLLPSFLVSRLGCSLLVTSDSHLRQKCFLVATLFLERQGLNFQIP